MGKQWVRTGIGLVAIFLTAIWLQTGCGSPQVAGGCSVNGTYYPNGNAPGGQCVCPPIGSCTITWPGFVPAQVAGRMQSTMTVLSADAILIAGGRNAQGAALNTADLYNPATRTVTPIGSRMTTARFGHAATLLPDGMVLLAGGSDGMNAALDSAELFDPESKTFAPLGSRMVSPRSEPSATLLPDGTVLIAGGRTGAVTLDSAELFDPMTRAMVPLDARMMTGRSAHEAMLLPSGDVVLWGGRGTDGGSVPAAEVYEFGPQKFGSSGRR